MNLKDYVSGKEICQIRGVNHTAMYSWKIPYTMVGTTRFYRKSDILTLRPGKSNISFKEAIDKAFNFEGYLPTSEICKKLNDLPDLFQLRYTRGSIHMDRIFRQGTYWYKVPKEVYEWEKEGYVVTLLNSASKKSDYDRIVTDSRGNTYGLYI